MEFIQAIYQTIDSEQKDKFESFLLPTAEDYFEFMTSNGYLGTDFDTKSQDKMLKIRNKVNRFSEDELLITKENIERRKEGSSLVSLQVSKKISKKELIMGIYERESGKQYDVEQLDPEDARLKTFFSTVNLVDDLCNISEFITSLPEDMQLISLIEEIAKINYKLPANVYVPFSSESIRNYVIVHIPVSEIKIFKTKERAPYLITLECVRLEEISKF